MLNDYIIIIWSPLTVFPFFFAFLTSLIQLILWLKVSTDKRQAEDTVGGEGPRTEAPAPSHFCLSSQSRANINVMGKYGLRSQGPWVWILGLSLSCVWPQVCNQIHLSLNFLLRKWGPQPSMVGVGSEGIWGVFGTHMGLSPFFSPLSSPAKLPHSLLSLCAWCLNSSLLGLKVLCSHQTDFCQVQVFRTSLSSPPPKITSLCQGSLTSPSSSKQRSWRSRWTCLDKALRVLMLDPFQPSQEQIKSRDWVGSTRRWLGQVGASGTPLVHAFFPALTHSLMQ